MIHKRSITKICIDDFALKKRESYGTIMIDFDSRQIVDMIPSREYDDVKAWLKTYPNVILVSRDGSVTYHNAVADALPKASQVSDRFHLLKNLTSYAQEYLKKELAVNVKIPVTCSETPPIPQPASKADENRKLTLKEKYDLITTLADLGYTKTAICKSLNMDIRAYGKLVTASPDELEIMFQTSTMLFHEDKLQQKIDRVNEIRAFKKQCFSLREISRRTGLAQRTVSKYLNDDFNPVHAAYGKKRYSILMPYMNGIDHMLFQGIPGTVIEAQIREKGYAGSSSSVRHYIANWKRNRKQDFDHSNLTAEAVEIIERKNLFKLLFHPLEKVKSITIAQFDSVCMQYPCFKQVHTLVWAFKSLLDSKDPSGLEPWLENAKSLNIREIKSFTEGILRDFTAVKNAIAFQHSNGLAEGSVNKLKVIKRVMYGRCRFETLRIKMLRLEEFRRFN
ncbi:MAG: ISL3 family transposase [Syntrophomonadaceae bacterium]|nr:ISL3 family transposase [Syntrophomonadaceae bacterium]